MRATADHNRRQDRDEQQLAPLVAQAKRLAWLLLAQPSTPFDAEDGLPLSGRAIAWSGR